MRRSPELRLAVEHRLGARELLGGLALEHVRRDRERAARESHHRGLAVELPAHQPDRLEQLWCRVARIDDAQRRNIGLGANGCMDDRPDPWVDREWNAHADQRQHDVGVHHGCIDAELLDRHQCHPGAQLGGPRDGEDVVGLAERSVPGEASPGLAHKPDRGAVGGFASSGGEHAFDAGHRVGVSQCHGHRG